MGVATDHGRGQYSSTVRCSTSPLEIGTCYRCRYRICFHKPQSLSPSLPLPRSIILSTRKTKSIKYSEIWTTWNHSLLNSHQIKFRTCLTIHLKSLWFTVTVLTPPHSPKCSTRIASQKSPPSPPQ